MRILLLRHGDAADLGAGITRDAERPLTREGIQKLTAAAATYARLVETPERLLASPRRRARESAEILARATGFHGRIESDESLHPESDPDLVLSLLHGEVQSGRGSIALVGHEPHLGALLGLLVTGIQHAAIPLKKGMLVAVDLEESTSLVGRLVLAIPQRSARDLA